MTSPNPRALLRAHLTLSGLSQPDYCLYKLAGRSPRILAYWLSGGKAVPVSVVKWLESLPEYPKLVELASTPDPTGSP